MKFLCVFSILVATISSSEDFSLMSIVKHYDKCQLREELKKHNFPTNSTDHLVCIFMDGSSGFVSLKERDRETYDYRYGLFQLRENEWCSPDSKGGECNAECKDFLNEDITEAATCALKAFNEKGFDEWPVENEKCQNKSLTFEDCS